MNREEVINHRFFYFLPIFVSGDIALHLYKLMLYFIFNSNYELSSHMYTSRLNYCVLKLCNAYNTPSLNIRMKLLCFNNYYVVHVTSLFV